MLDTITNKEFKQVTNEHFFDSEESFISFIEKLDPVDEVVDVKREINWEPVVRNCLTCGKEFTANHPAIMYCEEHRTN